MFFFTKPRIVNRKKPSRKKLEWVADPLIQKQMEEIIATLGLFYVRADRVYCYRTTGSKARAYARIWSFPKIFQQVLSIEPAYVLEIISEKFDGLNADNKQKVIIHELLHIPKNFSGSLLPHSNGHTSIEKEVNVLFDRYRNSR
jgi:predicted metallopeptidase